MNTKMLLTGLLGAGCVAPAVAAKPAKAAKKAEKPNIIIVYTDDMGVGDVSFLSSVCQKSPNIDALAKSGLVVDGYYSAAPVSSPSRVGVTTGMFPLQWGVNTFLHERKGNANCEQVDYLDASAPTIARSLKGAGYTTGHFGKWHMGGGRDVNDAPSITAYGFDEYSSTWESPDADPALTATNWIWSDKDQVKRWDRTAYFVDKTLDFLKRHKGQPCFVNLWPDDVHTPWVPGPQVKDNEKSWSTPPNLDGVMKEYDKQIGRLMKGLEELGLRDNTIIVFTSDNGPAPSFEQRRTNQLRGCKNSLYEGGIKMPFAISWPARIKPGQVDKTSVVCAVDLLPTFCAIAGAELPKGFVLAGEDMSKALTGTPQTRAKDLMWDFGRNQYFGKPGDKNNRSPHLAIRRGDWKLLMGSDGQVTELYNLKSDKNETQNVAAQNPEMVADLSKALKAWWDTRKVRE